ncbi:TRAP dicarboxylate transporter, DctQ subunit, unknown substrate 5 [plant metagenome]|uniref:Tripartite ATP-independent periplasmic transporters DctQ component domain-containing protein n=1 Tax=plant metagenome TaxID=1297885 RepID=A0A484XZJ8_9ZZZZ
MRQALNTLYRTAGVLACLFLIAIAVLTMATIISRMFGLEIYSTDEFAGWCMAASTFLALASTLRKNEHIRVSLLIERLAPSRRKVCEMLCLLVATVFMGIFAWYAVAGMIESHTFGEVTQGMVPVPMWIPQIGMAVGAVIMFIALADDLVCALRGRDPSYLVAKPVSVTEQI